MIAFLQNVWWLLVLIGVMILIHELGHFWAARIFDVKVDVFSFGTPPGFCPKMAPGPLPL